MSQQQRPSMPRTRLALFSLLVTCAFFGLLEGAVRMLEPRLAPERRRIVALPGPANNSDLLDGLMQRINLDRDRLEKQLREQPIPLEQDQTRGWSLPRDTRFNVGQVEYRVNSLGLRGPELGQLEPGEARLLTLGDSSIFGDNVREEKVFSSVAADLLSKAWGRPVRGVIGATPGHDSGQSLTTLEQIGAAVEPAWVVIGNLWSDVYRQDRGQTARIDAAPIVPVQQRLRGFATYRVLVRVLEPWLLSRQVRFIASRDDVGALKDGPPTRVPLATYIHNLRSMAARAKALKARPAFVILPAPMDFDRVPPPQTIDAFRHAMRLVAEESGAPVVDGPVLFRERGASLAYFIDQVHPSEAGHALLGAALAEALEKAGPTPAAGAQ